MEGIVDLISDAAVAAVNGRGSRRTASGSHVAGTVAIGVGFLASVHFLPEGLDSVYGGSRPDSYLAFARFRLK